MLRKNNFFILILIEISFLLFLIIIIPTLFLREKPGISQIYFENTLPLDINHSYLETFISDRNNLNSVSVLLKNPALKSHNKVNIEIQSKDNKFFQSLEISGQGIQDPSWIKVKFSPINSKKGDIFYIKIISDAQKDNNLYIYGNKNNQSINFKTTYKSLSLKDSLKDNISYQASRLSELNKFQSIFYLTFLITVNLLLFISL
jgi:hypothetical protein